MAKKKKSKKREKPSRRDVAADTDESRAAETLTVAWMLALLVTLGAEVIAFAGWGWIAMAGEPGVPERVRMIFGLLMLTSALTGIVCMLMIPGVYRLRRNPPPKAITVFAVAASSIPILTIVLLTIFR